nr:unnamed protein product [Spirometra erinaceieuropaei]
MSCPISVSEPVFKQMVTREDFEQFETAVLDADYRQKVTSYLCTLGGDKIVTFAQRIFASLFSDEITYHVTFFGRHQQKRPFFGSITYGIVLDVFSSWSADHKSDLYQLERAFRYSFKKAYDRLYTLFPTDQKRPNPVQKISPDADGAQFVKKTLVRDSVKSLAEIDVYDIDLKTLF